MTRFIKWIRRWWQWLTATPTCCECGTSLGRQIVWLDKIGPYDWVCPGCSIRHDYPTYVPSVLEQQ